jgi:hypothetical protein
VQLDEDEPHFVIVDMLIARYLLEELIASRLLPRRSEVIDGVLISGRVGPSIRFVIADCMMTA